MMSPDVNNLAGTGREVTSKWGWFLALGVLLLLIGIIASLTLPFATITVVIFIGIMMVFAGVAQLVHAFGVKDWGRFFMWFLAGLLYTIAGVVCFTEPVMGAAVFTFLLGFVLIISGIVRIIVGLQSTSLTGWGWIVTAGVLTTLVGIIIVSGWPGNSFWILGLFLAIDLIFQGWSWIAFSFGLKSLNDSQH